jgi:hypothetical protein
MELDLNYEESKKILELGYDFSKVCTFFGKGNPTYVKVNDDVYLPGCCEQWGKMVYPGPYGGELPEGETPIIPKAALLMALPSFERGVVSKDHEHLSFEISSDFRFAYLKETHSGKTVKHFSSDDENPALIKAFLWVHEKYPEELKAKFKKELRV